MQRVRRATLEIRCKMRQSWAPIPGFLTGISCIVNGGLAERRKQLDRASQVTQTEILNNPASKISMENTD